MSTLPYLTDTSVQLSGTYTTSTAPLDNFVSSNYVNFLSSNNSNYTRNASNVLQTNINTTNTNLTATNTNLTNNYYNRTSTDTLLNAKENSLSFTAPLTRSTNTININLGSYSTTGSDPNYLLKTGGTMTGALLNTSGTASEFKGIYINHPTRITHIPYLPDNKIYFRAPVVIDTSTDTLSFGSRVEDFLIYLYSNTFGFGINGATLRYNVPVGSVHRFYHGSTNTAWIDDTGRLKATTFEGSGASLTNVPYTALTGSVPFYTKGEADTLLNAKQATLTGTTTLLGTGGSITALDYNKITTNPLSFTAPLSKSGTNVVSIDLSTYALNTALTTAQTNNSNYASNISNVLLINYNSLNTTTNINNSNYASNISNVIIRNSSNYASNISNVLNINSSNYASNISNVLNINSSNYASNISNVLNINSSNYASNISNVIIRNSSNYASNISNVLNINSSNYASNISNVIITNTNATYLKLNGTNTMTAGLNFNNIISTKVISLYDASPANNFQFVGFGNNNGLCINTYQESDAFQFKVGMTATTSKEVMRIGGNGNVGIGNSVPLGTLSIGRPDSGDNDGTLVISKRQGGGNRNFKMGYDSAFNFCFGDFGFGLSGNTWASSHFIINYSTGYIGIGTTSVNNILQVGSGGRLRIANGITDYTIIGTKDINDNTINTKILLSGNTYAGAGNNGGIQYYGSASGAHVFYTTDSGTERMRIKNNGYVGIGTDDPKTHLQVNGLANITNGSAAGIPYMQSGSLTIGGTNADYGCQFYSGGSWTGTNTAGLLMECFNNTEIVIHDNAKRLVSAIAYFGDTTNTLYIGRAMGWDGGAATPVNIPAALTVGGQLTVASYANTKYTYLGGLRIAGWDGNTLYQDTGDMGFTVHNTTPKITFNFFGGNNTIMDIKNTSINFYQNVIVNAEIYLKNDVWHRSAEGAYRLYFAGGSGTTYLAGGNTDSGGICTMFMSGSVSGYANLMSIYNNGNIIMGLSSTNSAFLIVHGSIACRLFSVNKTNTDYVGTQGNRPSQGSTVLDTLCNLYDTFTGMHRCFTEDELYNKEDPQKFKDDYVGRIVISTGKIATDLSNENNGWDIYYDKDGITQEDAVPMIELSRKKKDKRVFGVMGSPTRKNSRAERMIINSIGEGPILVCNCNGNIENGDYITSSDYLGYGERQDDDLLHNYTVGKATMSCDFQLDSPFYNCYEIDDLDANGVKLRVALIACTYHSG